MNIYTNTPYTYRISWSKTGMNYVGARWAKNCHPSDLFVTYFTSSKYVANYIKEHGIPDIVEIIETFTSKDKRQKVRLSEADELVRLDAVNRDDYLNKHDGITYSKDVVMPHDETIYDWEHADGTKLSCTRVDLVSRYGLRAEKVTEIVNGTNHRKSHGGWRLAGTKAGIDGTTRSGPNNHGFDHTKYSFIHDSGISERCTRHHLYTTYDLDPHKIMLLIRGDRNHHKGWRLAV